MFRANDDLFFKVERQSSLNWVKACDQNQIFSQSSGVGGQPECVTCNDFKPYSGGF